jgi:pyruvate/2-oxoacid:ferredoxin oxidoreductase alpha subunit
VRSGELDARFIKVESEHSAMAACVGASAAGVRTFTATSSHGLALHARDAALGGRRPAAHRDGEHQPRAGPGWNIWVDQNDSLSQRDTGWIQLYCETNQEVLDTTIQAFRLAEAVDLPVMVVLDAFYLSHTSEPVDIPEQALVDGSCRGAGAHRQAGHGRAARVRRAGPARRLHGDALGPAGRHGPAHGVVHEIDAEWARLTGRALWAQSRRTAPMDAELLLVTSGTITSTARDVIDERRARASGSGW